MTRRASTLGAPLTATGTASDPPAVAGPASGAARAPSMTPARRRRAWLAFLLGVASVLVVRQTINKTNVADYLVSPLLVADTAAPADAIVVPGAGVVGRCLPNLNAVRRIWLAARLYKAGRAPLVLISGGRPPGQDCDVATVMAQAALELGVPPERTLLEHAARSTHENAVLSAPLLRQAGARRILVVTDRLHMRRAAGVFETAGFTVERASVSIPEGHTNNVSMLLAGLREYVALAYYRWLGHLGPDVSSPAPAASRLDAALPALIAAAMTSQTSPAPPVIVVIGASYAGAWPLTAVGPHTVVNKGVPGQQSFEVAERFDRDVVALRPRAVIIWGFINDVFRSGRDVMPATLARTRQSFDQMIESARRAGIEPVLATEVTVGPKQSWSDTIMGYIGWMLGKESYQQYINQHVVRTNEWVRERGAREGLLVLDLENVLAGQDRMRRPEFSQEDGSHISKAGYDALTAYARPALERRFAR